MYVGRLLCVPSLLLASCLYLLKDLPWPCTASCCCCCSGGGGGGSQGKGRARREHLRMTAGVQLHGVTQSAAAAALPCSAKPEVSAEQRGERRASVCLQRREESIYCWKEEGRTPLWFDKQYNIQYFLMQLLVCVACVIQNMQHETLVRNAKKTLIMFNLSLSH